MLFNDAILAALAIASVADAWSPTNGYAPALVDCEKGINLTRPATGLSQSESQWVQKKEVGTKEALRAFLARSTANFSDASLVDTLLNSRNATAVPRVGIAASGGGYRAMFGSAGMVAAMDNRTTGANEHGLGGLLQSATYLSALSGGSWFASTIVFNNWTSVQEIVDQMSDTNASSIWNTAQSPFTPGGTNNSKLTSERYKNITEAVDDKFQAGFPISLADVWGLAFAYSFFPSLPQGGVGYTWSTLQEIPEFTSHEMPFLIELTKVQSSSSGKAVDLESPTVEINPFEIGSWDPAINGFSQVKYLGTNVSNGAPATDGKCIEGFDNVDFFFGTSSNLIEYIDASNVTSYKFLINQLASIFLGNQSKSSTRDVALYSPNPFKNTHFYADTNGTSEYTTDDQLSMIDGGSDGQTIPFTPLMRQERAVDVVFALDFSSDGTDGFPNGISVINSYERQFLTSGKNEAFPYVPGLEAFVDLGLNKRPTFFGCDAANLTDLAYVPPLVVYLPNAEYTYPGNVSTFQQSFNVSERRDLIRNSFEAATMGNMTYDKEFQGCVACAVMRRKQEASNATWPAECETCFDRYCWDGSLTKKNAFFSNLTASGFASASGNATESMGNATASAGNNTAVSSLARAGSASASASASASVSASASANTTSTHTSATKTKNAGFSISANSGLLWFAVVNVLYSLV